MSQVSGVFTIELDATHLADQIADRVLARLHEAARDATGGSATYDRPAEPDPGAGPRRGRAGFGDVTDDGLSGQER